MASQFTTRDYRPFDLIHFTVRGHERRVIFHDGNDHEEFLGGLRNRLDTLKGDSEMQLLAFAQMPNHQHVFVRAGADPTAAPKLMRSLCTSYAMSYNPRHRRNGKVFQRPFRGRVVRGVEHIMNTFAYIHLNPDASLRTENSSHGFYAGLRDDPHLDPSLAWRVFNGRDGYMEFFADSARIRAARRSARRRLS